MVFSVTLELFYLQDVSGLSSMQSDIHFDDGGSLLPQQQAEIEPAA
jgi:hypothetical protein